MRNAGAIESFEREHMRKNAAKTDFVHHIAVGDSQLQLRSETAFFSYKNGLFLVKIGHLYKKRKNGKTERNLKK